MLTQYQHYISWLLCSKYRVPINYPQNIILSYAKVNVQPINLKNKKCHRVIIFVNLSSSDIGSNIGNCKNYLFDLNYLRPLQNWSDISPISTITSNDTPKKETSSLFSLPKKLVSTRFPRFFTMCNNFHFIQLTFKYYF